MSPMGSNPTLSHVEKRAYARVPFTRKLVARDLKTGKKYWANGIDISVMGIGFFSKKFFPKNDRVSVQVWLDSQGKVDPVWMNGTVKWAKLEQGGAIIGIQFDSLIKSAEHPELYKQIYETTA
ncbi:MAG: PilZ domain-containing protein [Sedimentisphaerales bacterium]|nr:PilZ domain-containing protein [Sedimentisphaerales bacterium]